MSKKNKNIPQPKEYAPVVETKPVVTNYDMTRFYGGKSEFVVSHLNTVDQYIRAMAPGIMVQPAVGALYQQHLFEAMMAILNAENVDDMISGTDALLIYFKQESKGALNFKYTQRFFESWLIDVEQRELYSNLCLIFSTFADDVKRLRFGQDFQLEGEQNILRNMESEARTRLIQYLNRKLM